MRVRMACFSLLLGLAASAMVFHVVNGMTISPLRQSLILDPGGKETISIVVKNDTTSAVRIVGDIDAFSIDEKTGRPIFGRTDEAESWIDARDARATLQGGEEKELVFHITVPPDAVPGGHYLGLFARTEPPQGVVGIGSRVGSLLFLYVGGEVQEILTRTAFTTDRSWYTKGPAKIFLQMVNSGSIHSVPTGIVRVETWRGRTVASFPINPNKRKILPGGAWDEAYTVDQFALKDTGPLLVTVLLRYGIMNQEQSDVLAMWFLPLPLLAFGILLLCVFVFLLYRSGARRSR